MNKVDIDLRALAKAFQDGEYVPQLDMMLDRTHVTAIKGLGNPLELPQRDPSEIAVDPEVESWHPVGFNTSARVDHQELKKCILDVSRISSGYAFKLKIAGGKVELAADDGREENERIDYQAEIPAETEGKAETWLNKANGPITVKLSDNEGAKIAAFELDGAEYYIAPMVID